MDRLLELLRRVLPQNPDDAIGGAELIQRLRAQGLAPAELTDNALRTYFSVLVKEESSPITRRQGQHGYFLRANLEDVDAAGTPEERPAVEQDGRLDGAQGQRDEQREEKFRSVYLAWSKRNSEFPVHVEHVEARRQPRGLNEWKFPDVVSVVWDVLKVNNNGILMLDDANLAVRASLGERPFRLSSTELKVGLSRANLRSAFFQCVSNSRWAHSSRLVIANPIDDELVVRELQRLGVSYGVAVQTFSLTEAQLDQLPAADRIVDADEVERLLGGNLLTVTTLVDPGEREVLDWEHIKDMQENHTVFRQLFSWISKCIDDKLPHQFEVWRRTWG